TASPPWSRLNQWVTDSSGDMGWTPKGDTARAKPLTIVEPCIRDSRAGPYDHLWASLRFLPELDRSVPSSTRGQIPAVGGKGTEENRGVAVQGLQFLTSRGLVQLRGPVLTTGKEGGPLRRDRQTVGFRFSQPDRRGRPPIWATPCQEVRSRS